MTFTIAENIEDVLGAMKSGARPIAGGTDLVVGARHGKTALPDDLVAIDRIPYLAEIGPGPGGLRIGSTVTHATLMTDPLVVGDFTALADAAALVGSPSTRNVGTIGGNVMNASPAMDTGAPLVVFGAVAHLRSPEARREVPVIDLWTGPGATSAAPDELLTGVGLPLPEDRSGSAYVRLEYRRAMEIAVVGAAARVALAEDGSVTGVSVALSAVAPTIIAVDGLAGLGGVGPAEAGARAEELAAEQATPISDLRASETYRRHCVGVMAKRAVVAAARRAGGETIPVPVNRSLGIGAA